MHLIITRNREISSMQLLDSRGSPLQQPYVVERRGSLAPGLVGAYQSITNACVHGAACARVRATTHRGHAPCIKRHVCVSARASPWTSWTLCAPIAFESLKHTIEFFVARSFFTNATIKITAYTSHIMYVKMLPQRGFFRRACENDETHLWWCARTKLLYILTFLKIAQGEKIARVLRGLNRCARYVARNFPRGEACTCIHAWRNSIFSRARDEVNRMFRARALENYDLTIFIVDTHRRSLGHSLFFQNIKEVMSFQSSKWI